MIINTFSYLWSGQVVDAFAELTDHGFREFEVPISSPHCWPDELDQTQRRDVAKMLSARNASVRSLNAGGYDLNLASPAATVRRQSILRIGEVIELAQDWGARDVVISPGTRRPMISPSIENVLGWMNESLETLIPMAEKAGVKMLLENTPYCFRPTIDELVDVVTHFGNDSLAIVYDVANAAFIEEDPADGLLRAGESVGLIHVSDTGTEVWGHDPIGTGVIDFDALGRAVEETGNSDNVVLEIIREADPVKEFKLGLKELARRGWRT